jgi:hypothetical protein
MAVFKEHRPGSFSYVELASPDPDGARAFYMGLFGWGVRDEDMGEHGIYTQFLKDGDVVGALYKLPQEQKDAGVPPNWALYLTVENADQAVAKVKELGGKVIMGPMDVFEHGRMCVVADPVGAVCCLWQAKDHIGSARKDEHGSLCWAEHMTSDVPASKAFYTGLFGWVTTDMDMGEMGTYHMMGHTPATMSCGMMEITDQMGPVPPHWMAYFQVDEMAGITGKAAELGGAVVVPPTGLPGGSFFAVMQDPQGAFFGLYQLGDKQDC